MESENVKHMITGALFEFVGFLTSRMPNATAYGSSISMLIIRTLEEFLDERGISKEYPAINWEDKLRNLT